MCEIKYEGNGSKCKVRKKPTNWNQLMHPLIPIKKAKTINDLSEQKMFMKIKNWRYFLNICHWIKTTTVARI